MHVAEARAHGLELSYALCDFDAESLRWRDLAAALADVQARGFAGVNVTYPFKQSVLPLLDELSPTASRLGAVNTVIFRDGRRIGHNTDGLGFAENFRRGLPGAPRRSVVQLGAGGAGAAVADALLEAGAERLSLFDTDRERADLLIARLGRLFGEGRVTACVDLPAEMAIADGLVNATPVGMAALPGLPLPIQLLRPDLWVADIVYVPIETELLRAARQLGCRTLGGGGMAVHQAAEAFALFTGLAPDVERMRSRFLADLGRGGVSGQRV